MPAGQKLKKWTWMMGNVTVRGTVLGFHGQDTPQADTPYSDGFDLLLDSNYQHITTFHYRTENMS
jgi:hypothetical protein